MSLLQYRLCGQPAFLIEVKDNFKFIIIDKLNCRSIFQMLYSEQHNKTKMRSNVNESV